MLDNPLRVSGGGNALKLVLNGSYGAFATSYFILFNNNVAGTITAEGRNLTRTMSEKNEKYWYTMWHTEKWVHDKLKISDVMQIPEDQPVSVYGDTDSVFVGFEPAIKSCKWQDQIFNSEYLNSIDKPFSILTKTKFKAKFKNSNLKAAILVDKLNEETESKIKDALSKSELLLIDGEFIKDWNLEKVIKDFKGEIFYNWKRELDFIHGLDKFRFADYFKECLDELAASYGVENKQDFELERVSESIINIAKKKYIQHIVYEDGIPYDRLTYLFPKGVELVRSSTPLFARDKIIGIVKYLFEHPDTFNIKELLKLVKNLKKEFDLCVPDRIDDISMQSSCSNYEEKVLNDKDRLEFVTGTHFAVKASSMHNYLLHKNKHLQSKYEFIKSGTKIKYYYCKDKSLGDIFAYIRGSHPLEFSPEIDLDLQFAKCILSPINSIIEPLGLPKITERLSVVMSIFG